MDPRLLKIRQGLNTAFNDLLTIIDGLLPPIVPPVPPIVTGLPDPRKLPVATKAQVPVPATYNMLRVPALVAGGSYNDPVTGVKVYKLTSPTFPGGSSRGYGHDYAEGGDEISLPHTGTTRTILVRDLSSQVWWLIDFTPGVGVANPRQLTGNLAPWIDNAFAFSNDVDTPHLAYVSTFGGIIRRFDVRTMQEVPGQGWPITDLDTTQPYGFPIWLHQAIDDSLFTWMRGANGPTVVGYEPATKTLKTRTLSNTNEPRIDRAGRYIAIACAPPNNSLAVWDWQTDTITWQIRGDAGTGDVGQIPFMHVASLRRRFVGLQWNMGYPPPFWSLDPSIVNSHALVTGGSGPGNPIHGNGNWIQPLAAPDDQWAVFNMYGEIQPSDGFAWLAPGAMMLMTPGGQRRCLAHAYNTSNEFAELAYAKFSSDGRYVLFTSNMNGGPRCDVFLAELPVS